MRTDKLLAYGLLKEKFVHKKAFPSRANRLFSRVNKFVQFLGDPKVNKVKPLWERLGHLGWSLVSWWEGGRVGLSPSKQV